MRRVVLWLTGTRSLGSAWTDPLPVAEVETTPEVAADQRRRRRRRCRRRQRRGRPETS